MSMVAMNGLGEMVRALALTAAQGHGAGGALPGGSGLPIAQPTDGLGWAGWILWLPLISLIGCGVCAALRVRNKLPALITAVCLAGAFGVTLALYFAYESPVTVHLFDWFNIHWGTEGDPASFIANFSLYIDTLTLFWMLFVTGLGTLIAIYASEYMEADVSRGYARFFAGVSVFLFAMSCLVMGDNLVMLYLGWEGVGFASYWLIGYYYTKPSAVAAAKKAFIVNRIGDLGLALGIWLTYHAFGTVEYAPLFERLTAGDFASEVGGWQVQAIPFLFMLGAFGKSAQLPLYVWLPDAMEGPTPVSALIHAATMVTAGVYLIARTYPLFMLNEYALPTVAWIGGLTALLAATIGMAQYDFKRIWAYSTVSQLGYMFLGLGVVTTFGAAYHVFTHAFFKAVLFLTAGAVMHGFAGQLDLRKLSGLRRMRGWGITVWTMLIGCLCLAGFPFSSGFFSKDAILAEAFVHERYWLGWIAVLTAGLTAYYTFRVWFRICLGPVHYEPGDEHVPGGDAEAEHEATHEPAPAHDHGGHGGHVGGGGAGFHPHAPRWAINGVLVIITIGAILAAWPGVRHGGWVLHMVDGSTAAAALPEELGHDVQPGVEHIEPAEVAHGTLFGLDPHFAMYFVSGGIGLLGILIAAYLHWYRRESADRLRQGLLASPATRWLPVAMENKWYVDEVYHGLIRAPLWAIGHVLALFDRYIVDGVLVDGTARIPRWLGRLFQPMQNGILQNYAVAMAGGVALIALLVLFGPQLVEMLNETLGITGPPGAPAAPTAAAAAAGGGG